jgi:hypothetical protein
MDALTRTKQVELARTSLKDNEKRAKLAAIPDLEGPLRSAYTARRLVELDERLHAEIQLRRAMFFTPQRLLLEQFEEHAPEVAETEALNSTPVRECIVWAGAVENTPRWKAASPWQSKAIPIAVIFLVIPLGLAFLAAVFRGGISWMLAGIALIRSDGRRASRRQCGVRAALVWFPIALLLGGSAACQLYSPERAYSAAALWLIALALLPVYVAIALRFPTRAPQDRLVGTYLLPN